MQVHAKVVGTLYGYYATDKVGEFKSLYVFSRFDAKRAFQKDWIKRCIQEIGQGTLVVPALNQIQEIGLLLSGKTMFYPG